jgi:hypothetical protein
MGEKKPVPEHRFLPTDERRKAVGVFYTLISGLLPDGSAAAWLPRGCRVVAA